MLGNLLYIISGFVPVRVSAAQKERAVSCLVCGKIKYFGEKLSSEGELSFNVSFGSFKRLKALFEKENILFSSTGVKGLPHLFKKYGKRLGVYIGILIFAVIISVSGKYVWFIEVTGNENVQDSQILENLEALGFGYGSNFKKFDFDYLRNEYLATYNDLSWISVNMEGTYAHIEVRELFDPRPEDMSAPANVVASEDGRIVLVEAKEGRPLVFPGDFVKKGDLLLSGLLTDGEDSLRLEHASGKVTAEVKRTFTVEVQKKSDEKIYTGDEKSEKKLKFFKKNIKLSGNCRISDQCYDTIIKNTQMCLFHTIPLPVFYEKTVYREYTLESKSLSESEVRARARAIYSEKLSETLGDAELMEESFTEYETDEMYVKVCRITCLADIAGTVEIQSTDKAGEQQ